MQFEGPTTTAGADADKREGRCCGNRDRLGTVGLWHLEAECEPLHALPLQSVPLHRCKSQRAPGVEQPARVLKALQYFLPLLACFSTHCAATPVPNFCFLFESAAGSAVGCVAFPAGGAVDRAGPTQCASLFW